jgi:VanZ family protein
MLIPGRDVPKVEVWIPIDKIVHAGVFLIFSLLMIFGFSRQISFLMLKKNAILFTFLFSILYGITTEFIQRLATDRSFDIWDIVANIVGGILGILIFEWSGKKIPFIEKYLEKYLFN